MAQGGIAIMGAGAVGCYYGGRLSLAGQTVTLIGRPALLQAVMQSGLTVEEGGQRRITHPLATDDPAGVAGADLVLVCVKSGDTAAAARAIAPHLAPWATILSLQNGIGNAELLTQVLGRPVIAVVVYVAAEIAGPGHVRHNGRGELILTPGAGAEAAALRLAAAGIRAEVSPEAQVALWTKFTINCCYNAFSALTRQPYGVIDAQPGARDLMRAVMEECIAVAKASGVSLPEDLWQKVLDVARQMAGQHSSTAQDMRRGKPTEIDQLNGEVVRRAAALGLTVPVNNALWVMVKLAEAAP